jgi:hypothetical protein
MNIETSKFFDNGFITLFTSFLDLKVPNFGFWFVVAFHVVVAVEGVV